MQSMLPCSQRVPAGGLTTSAARPPLAQPHRRAEGGLRHPLAGAAPLARGQRADILGHHHARFGHDHGAATALVELPEVLSVEVSSVHDHFGAAGVVPEIGLGLLLK
jgi:hypothetical protein